MTRKTSIQAYNQIKAEGLLGRLNQQTYELLYEHGPMTANEMMRLTKLKFPTMSHQSIESVGRRLSDLRNHGTVYEVDEVTCPITHRKVILWDVTDQIPQEPEHKMTAKEKIAFLKGTIDIALQAMRDAGLDEAATEVTKNLEIVNR